MRQNGISGFTLRSVGSKDSAHMICSFHECNRTMMGKKKFAEADVGWKNESDENRTVYCKT